MLDLIIPNVLLRSDFFMKAQERVDDPFIGGEWSLCCFTGILFVKKLNLLDLIPYSNTRKINNSYKDTKNYDPSDKDAIDPKILDSPNR